MSIAEIKVRIDQMTDEERFFAAAYLHHRAQQRDATYGALLDERMARMDKGQKITHEQVQGIHRALENEGL